MFRSHMSSVRQLILGMAFFGLWLAPKLYGQANELKTQQHPAWAAQAEEPCCELISIQVAAPADAIQHDPGLQSFRQVGPTHEVLSETTTHALPPAVTSSQPFPFLKAFDCTDCSLTTFERSAENVLASSSAARVDGESGKPVTSTASQSVAELVADRMYLRTGVNSGQEVNNPIAGQQYFVHFDWRNTGTAANNFRIEIRLNGGLVCAVNDQDAPANSARTTVCNAAVTWPAGGAVILGILDENGDVSEGIENNNEANRFFGHQIYSDFELTCQVRSTENFGNNATSDFCFIYGFQDEFHYYYVMFNSDGNTTRVFKIKELVRTELATLGNFSIPDNDYHEVKIRRTGNTVRVFFDGQQLGSATDAEYGAGGLGLASYNDAAFFDDICIRPDPQSDCVFTDNFESGNAGNWIPLHAARWQVSTDQGDRAYRINTTNYENAFEYRLGEYSLLAAQIDLLADRVFLRTGGGTGPEVDRPLAGQQYFIHFNWFNTGSARAANFRFDIRLNDNVVCFYDPAFADPNSTHNSWCTTPVTWPTGTNTIRGVLDVDNVIAETNENNNSARREFPPAPELSATRLYLRTGQNSGPEVDNPAVGTPYFVHFDWRNTGGATSENFRVETRRDNSVLCFNNNQSAGANSTVTSVCSTPVTFVTGTTVTFQGLLDVNNVIGEPNENNNTVSRTFSFQPPLADLVADRVYLRTGANSGTEVDHPLSGQQYFVHFDWRNAGAAAANNFRVDIRLNGDVVCFTSNQSAPANTNQTTFCSQAVTWPPGSNTLQGRLDVNNVIAESNENNNNVSRTFEFADCNPRECPGAAIFPVPQGGSLGDPITGRTGQTVCIDVRLKQNNVLIDAFGFQMKVDANRLTFLNAERGDLTTGFVAVNAQENPPGSGNISCGGFGSTAIPVNSQGVLMRLCFRVNCENATGSVSPVVLSNPTDDIANFSACCNNFVCQDCVSDGDVNNDRALTPGDAQCAFQIFLNNGGVPSSCNVPNFECEAAAADVNCDRTVTPGDALAIFNRFLAGQPPHECFAQGGEAKLAGRAAPYEIALQQRAIEASSHQNFVKIALMVNNPDGLEAFGLNLSYPAGKLTFAGVTRTAATAHWLQLEGQISAPGVITIGGFDQTALAGGENVEVLHVLFSAKDHSFEMRDFALSALVDDFEHALVKSSDAQSSGAVPLAFKLHQSYPNPFQLDAQARETIIRFDISGQAATRVELAIYNLAGQLVRQLVSGERMPGAYEIAWDGKNEQGRRVPSGTYLYKIKAGSWVDGRQMIVVH